MLRVLIMLHSRTDILCVSAVSALQTAIWSLLDVLFGESASLCTQQSLSCSSATKNRSLRASIAAAGMIKELDVLPNLLYALSHTTPQMTNQGLEFILMMVSGETH
jgi:predicted permease